MCIYKIDREIKPGVMSGMLEYSVMSKCNGEQEENPYKHWLNKASIMIMTNLGIYKGETKILNKN